MDSIGRIAVGHNVKLIVPTGNDLELAPIIGKIIGRWGGCTVTSGKGWWVDKKKGQIFDALSILECSIGAYDIEARVWWHDLASAVRAAHDQECVFLSVAAETAVLVYEDHMANVGLYATGTSGVLSSTPL